MPCSDDEEHSPSEFYYPGETNYPNATCQGERITPKKTKKNSYEKVFSGLFYKIRTIKPYNKSLINLVCSVCTGKYCLRFLSHRPRSFVARCVQKTSGNTFPYRPGTRLISPIYSRVTLCRNASTMFHTNPPSCHLKKIKTISIILFHLTIFTIYTWHFLLSR